MKHNYRARSEARGCKSPLLRPGLSPKIGRLNNEVSTMFTVWKWAHSYASASTSDGSGAGEASQQPRPEQKAFSKLTNQKSSATPET
jgi:hypothetical protein